MIYAYMQCTSPDFVNIYPFGDWQDPDVPDSIKYIHSFMNALAFMADRNGDFQVNCLLISFTKVLQWASWGRAWTEQMGQYAEGDTLMAFYFLNISAPIDDFLDTNGATEPKRFLLNTFVLLIYFLQFLHFTQRRETK